jgi:small multidrug resistance family-3 protein
VVAGLVALFAYAIVQTYQTEHRYGRLYAAYAGVFLVGAMLWGWLIDGRRPDVFDWAGATVVLVGASIILWGRRLFG